MRSGLLHVIQAPQTGLPPLGGRRGHFRAAEWVSAVEPPGGRALAPTHFRPQHVAPDGLRWVGARVAVRAAFQGPVSEPASDRTGGLGGPCGEEPLVPRPVSPEAGGAAEPDLSRPLRPPAAACPGPRPTGQARRLPTRLAFSVAATLASPCSHSLFWFAYSFKKLRSSRNVKVTLLKCTAQWHLVHPQRQFQASSLPPEGTLPGQPLVCLLGLHGSAHRSGARACLTAPTNVSWVRDGQCPKTAGQS